MIARYTRPAIGEIWTDEARMEAWRRVEVAACEAMDGPTEAELEAIRAATFTVEAVNEREAGHRPRRRGLRRRAQRVGRARRGAGSTTG